MHESVSWIRELISGTIQTSKPLIYRFESFVDYFCGTNLHFNNFNRVHYFFSPSEKLQDVFTSAFPSWLSFVLQSTPGLSLSSLVLPEKIAEIAYTSFFRLVFLSVVCATIFFAIGTVYFLGYIRLETPVVELESNPESISKSTAGPREVATCPNSAAASAAATGSTSSDSAAFPAQSAKHKQTPPLWLYECNHNDETYLCFPPYCAPGGLRSRLFPSATLSADTKAIALSGVSGDANNQDGKVEEEQVSSSEEQTLEEDLPIYDPFFIPFPTSSISHRKKTDKKPSSSSDTLYQTTNATNNPLDILLQSSLLPYFVKKSLVNRQHDWNTLGGSQCSYKRNLLAEERLKEYQRELEKKLQRQLERQCHLDAVDHSFKTTGESQSFNNIGNRELELTPSIEVKNQQGGDFVAKSGFRLPSSGSYSWKALASVTQSLVHQAVDYSSPILERALDSLASEQISPTYSAGCHEEGNSPQDQVQIQKEHHEPADPVAVAKLRKRPEEKQHIKSSSMPPAQDPSPPPSVHHHHQPDPSPPSSIPTNMDNYDPTNNDMAGKPIPQAVLVYHESAHSIVFRDHLRRQQSAIRQTSSFMENNSSHHGRSRSNSRTRQPKQHRHTVGGAPSPHRPHAVAPEVQRHTLVGAPLSTPDPTATESDTNDELFVSDHQYTTGGYTGDTSATETDMGYESAGSRGSSRSARSVQSGQSGGETSTTSAGSGRQFYGKHKPVVEKVEGKKHHHRHHSHSSHRQREVQASSPSAPVVVANFQPVVEPLDELELNFSSVFEPLLEADPWVERSEENKAELGMSDAEWEVVELLKKEQAVVKTIRNADWTPFLQKFLPSEGDEGGTHGHHPAEYHAVQQGGEAKQKEGTKVVYPFHSFVTSTSLLPSCGKKMRCFGSTNEYATGVVFAMPSAFPSDASEDEAAKRTRTWSWPSGYSAKTEFNIDRHGNLINGREEALVPLSGMRAMNHAYLYDTDYVVGGRLVKGGLTTIPYNEVYIRVGGPGRIACGVDVTTGKECNDSDGTGRSFDHGIGLPVALFVREADYGHLVGLLRTRARFGALFGREIAQGIPLLMITPELGVRVFTENLQHLVLKAMAWDINPFQNPVLAYRCGIDNTSETHLRQKLEELIDLDDDKMKQVLTPEEMARIAGGFGATDESVAHLLMRAMKQDIVEETNKTLSPDDRGHNLQDLVNEGLAFALRASDYHTSRQLLILYTLVASKRRSNSETQPMLEADSEHAPDASKTSSTGKNWREIEKDLEKEKTGRSKQGESSELSNMYVPPPPPPPPLDTDRLRSATNSDGLLAVLGAAQVLRAMQDGSAKRRVKESVDAIEEWIKSGEQSVAFRVASWRDQRAAQGDLKIAMENDSNFMAFISNKAIANRKKFAKQLRDAVAATDFDSLRFLKAIHGILSQMHSPCLRLELLQYILGLDNRYSVAHVKRSVELAATCLNISESDVFTEEKDEQSKMLTV